MVSKVTSLTFILIPLIILSFYWNLTGFSFLNFDDDVYVSQNSIVSQGLTWEGFKWAFTTLSQGHWHPITWLSHMLDVTLFGLDPWGHHLVNLLFFAANACLLFLLLRRLNFKTEWAFVGVLFFSLHPMRLETVAWVAERKDVLSFFLGFISILFFLTYSDKKSRSKWIYFGLSVLAFILSLMSKPTFVSLPLLLLLLDSHLHRNSNLKHFIFDKIPFFFISILSCLQAMFSQNHAGALQTYSYDQRIETSFVSFGAYLGKFFMPFQTTVFYPHVNYAPGVGVGMFVGLLMTSLYLYQLRKKWPLLWCGWIWFFIAALPISGIVAIGGQTFADRWTYLPHVGLLIGILSLLNHHALRSRLGIAMIFAICFVGFLTFKNIPHWKNSESLFRHALEVTPHNFMAHNNLGVVLEQSGRMEEATYHYEESVRLNPSYAEAVNNLGIARAKQSRTFEAIQLFQRALALDPSLIAAKQNLERIMPAPKLKQ